MVQKKKKQRETERELNSKQRIIPDIHQKEEAWKQRTNSLHHVTFRQLNFIW